VLLTAVTAFDSIRLYMVCDCLVCRCGVCLHAVVAGLRMSASVLGMRAVGSAASGPRLLAMLSTRQHTN
jgi:hypothetical protein